MRMHDDEIFTDADLLRRLLAGQFPDWADLPITPVESYGTDHDIYRVGEHLSARLPRIGWATTQATREAHWLPRLAPHLPLAIPVPVAMGRPTDGYPYEWSVCRWLPGANANGTIDDLERAAVDLAAFITALRAIDPAGAHPRTRGGRGCPPVELDDFVRSSIATLGDRIDGKAALRVWDVAEPYSQADFARSAGEEVRIFANSLATPYCGANTGFETAQWLTSASSVSVASATTDGVVDSANTTESIALLALRDPLAGPDAPAFGLLVMGSPDARRFHEGMATDFLTQIAALASAALSRLLPH